MDTEPEKIARREIAKRLGLPEAFGDRLQGDTLEEILADARAMAEALKGEQEPEHVQLARRALEVAESNPNKAELAALAAAPHKREHQEQLLRAVHGEKAPEPKDADAPPDFDGGARQSQPPPTDPAADHDALMLDAVRRSHYGGGDGGLE
jgi:hypothetical protein